MFHKSKGQPSSRAAVGEDLACVLPDDDTPWCKKEHLVGLNYYTVSIGLLAASSGYDDSMMNGLIALPQWYDFMDYPSGAWLGFINAVQALSSTLGYPVVAYFANRWGKKKGIFAFTPNKAGFILVLPAAILIAESPRYLISRSESSKARSILTKYHAGGDDHSL